MGLPDTLDIGRFRLTEDLAYRDDGILVAGTEIVARMPGEGETQRLGEFAAAGHPYIVAEWMGRRRYVPQSSVEALDEAAEGTLELCARVPEPRRPRPPKRGEVEREETAGPEDGAALAAELRAAGYSLHVARRKAGPAVWACGTERALLTPRVRARVRANQQALLAVLRAEPMSEVAAREADVRARLGRVRFEEMGEAAE